MIQIRHELGLPLSDSGGVRGKDLWCYEGRNAEAADVLFELLVEGVVEDYEFEVRLHPKRRWTTDFVVTLGNSRQIWVELDGFDGNGRPSGDYTQETEKFIEYRRRAFDVVVLSDSGYDPWYGRGVQIGAFGALLRRESEALRASPPTAELRELATRVGLGEVHLLWIMRRGLISPVGLLPEEEAVRRLINAEVRDELLSVEDAARELGMTRRVLDRRMESGALSPDHRRGKGTAYFRRSSLPSIRKLLGEELFSGDREALVDETAAARVAGISTSYLRKLVRDRVVSASEVRLEGGWPARWYAPDVVEEVRRLAGAVSPPRNWLTVDELAEKTRTSRTTVLRLRQRGVISGALCRPTGAAEASSWYFPPSTVSLVEENTPRARRRRARTPRRTS